MNLLLLLENGLFALGQVLRLPVMVLLWVCVFMALVVAGRTVAEAILRRRERWRFDLDAWLKGTPVLQAGAAECQSLPTELREFVSGIVHAHSENRLAGGGLENLLIKSEDDTRGALGSCRLLVKLGPSLGLIGTLIPMGTALAALAGGNLEAMAGQMVVAFTTTIIGLACGTIAFVALAVRQRWVAQAIREQRYLAEKAAIEYEQESVAHG